MTDSSLRIAFAGTPDFAAKHLQALLDAQHSVVAVYTQPDRRAGRGKTVKPGPVKEIALENNIAVYQPLDLDTPEQQTLFESLNIDVMIVVAYGLLLPQAILDIPAYGCLNVHASLLPRWRGAAPIERAILEGDTETGICIMKMDAGLDSGDVISSIKTPIKPDDNSLSLTERLINLGCEELLHTIDQINLKQPLTQTKQNSDLSTYARKLNKSEALIDWNHSAQTIQRQINAFYPRSPAFCFLNNQRVRFIESRPVESSSIEKPGSIISTSSEGLLIACRDSALLVQAIQLPGKKVNSIADILNGQPSLLNPGTLFLSEEVTHEG